MSKQIVTGTDAPLLEEYANAAIQQGEATLKGDYTTGNLGSDILTGIYKVLKGEGPNAQLKLRSLLTHPHKSVRIWAATHTLEVCPEDSERVLQEEGAKSGILEFTARITLDLWRKGELEFPS